ncbi:MAG TPA: NnrS family protein [Beijerinckiaceae bacterium]|nr:NnrS family protein [Beijerinckiaceae bacterium]
MSLRERGHDGPALLSYGFRPFFLFGSAYAGAAVLAWMLALAGLFEIPTALSPLDWHVHEMLYGYLAAVIAGFLLTAVPNWTGRLPIRGTPLLVLVLVWLAGRVAVSTSAVVGPLAAGLADCAFLALFAAAVAREIVAGRNWRNLKVLAILALLLAGNVIFHVEAQAGAAAYGSRLGIAAAIALIALIGGRIVPSFTRNWLARQGPGRLPAPFDRFDLAAMGIAGLALAAWVVAPDAAATGLALLAAAAAQATRLARWAGERTFGERIVLILHVGYAFVPLGFALLGAAVMSRASLGHTGRPVATTPGLEAVYAAAVGGALLRVGAAAFGLPVLLHVSALAFAAAFLGFALLYAPVLTRPRLA